MAMVFGIVLELVLTAVAYGRGWKFRALMPLGAACAIGFTIGVLEELSGTPPESLAPILLLLGLGTKGWLLYLCVRKPSQATEGQELPPGGSRIPAGVHSAA